MDMQIIALPRLAEELTDLVLSDDYECSRECIEHAITIERDKDHFTGKDLYFISSDNNISEDIEWDEFFSKIYPEYRSDNFAGAVDIIPIKELRPIFVEKEDMIQLHLFFILLHFFGISKKGDSLNFYFKDIVRKKNIKLTRVINTWGSLISFSPERDGINSINVLTKTWNYIFNSQYMLETLVSFNTLNDRVLNVLSIVSNDLFAESDEETMRLVCRLYPRSSKSHCFYN